jgi:hypothetical protein
VGLSDLLGLRDQQGLVVRPAQLELLVLPEKQELLELRASQGQLLYLPARLW